MREILFRGKTACGLWVQGDLIHRQIWRSKFEVIRIDDNGFDNYTDYEVATDTIGQYTGLTDKNGNKIFEGDIVKIKDYSKGCALNYEQPTSNWVVKWNEKYAQFTIDYMSLLPYKHFDESEVVGNIHDNPELLKECEGK